MKNYFEATENFQKKAFAEDFSIGLRLRQQDMESVNVVVSNRRFFLVLCRIQLIESGGNDE